jgi:predicted PurR-regulated permease PerM
MEFIKELFKKEVTKEVIAFTLLALLIYAMKSMLNLILLTFLVTYLVYSFQSFILGKLKRFMRVNEVILTLVLYISIVALIAILARIYLPVLVKQVIYISKEFTNIAVNSNNASIKKYILPFILKFDITQYLNDKAATLVESAISVGKWGLNIIFAVILSLFFMIGQSKIRKFFKGFETSRIADQYKYMKLFALNFVNSFGKVISAQLIIAFCNTTLSIVALSILRFPQILALGFMIFLFSLVPIAGVILSLIPLTLIAFKIGGVIKVVDVLIIVLVLHSLESYVLNPKFMSDKTDLPVFLVFVILIISEHFMGVWGLLIGIPLFIFALDLFKIKYKP